MKLPFLSALYTLYTDVTERYPSPMRIVRFVISGGTATAVNLCTLFVLTHFFEVWYIYSSIAAFAISFFVSFALQKLWTFGNTNLDSVHLQASKFLTVILVALGINTTLIYIFVEYMHVHYLIGQLVSGLLIAVINYFSYKHLVFSEPRRDTVHSEVPQKESMTYFQIILLFVAVSLFVSLALFRLSENPPTWMDEGVIDQISINLSAYGMYGIQTAPGTFVSANFMTTSFPVFYPVAVSFSVFGTTLFNARIVMFFFMALFCVLGFFLVRSVAKEKASTIALSSLFLIVTFAPLYGHGKNVLGEVPGLLFFVASLFTLTYAQRVARAWLWLLSGVLLGLSMITKPLYLLIILPTLVIMLAIMYRRISIVHIASFGLGIAAMLVLWFFVHVTSIVVLKEILFAANTNNVALSVRVLENASQFISQLQPMYFLGLLSLWWGSLFLRRRATITISDAELFAAIFSTMNLLLYLASRGFYRYFFPAEILALLFLPIALYETRVAASLQSMFLKLCSVLVICLVSFQTYQTFFHSWISDYRTSTRSALLSENLRSIGPSQSIFLYNVPESVIFLPTTNYYQYLRFGDNSIRGQDMLPLLFAGVPDFVLVDQKFDATEQIVDQYTERARFDKYVLYERRGY